MPLLKIKRHGIPADRRAVGFVGTRFGVALNGFPTDIGPGTVHGRLVSVA